MGKIGLVVNYNGHWDSSRFMGSSPFAVCVTTEVKYDQLLEKIYRRAGVNRDRFELKLSTMANTKTGKKILPIVYDGDVEFVLTNAECTPEIFVEVVARPASFSKDAEDTAGEGNGKEGVGNPKRDGGKPSECGTSRNADKKRKIMSEGESSRSYETGNGDEDEDDLNTGHPTRRYSRQKQYVSYSENKNEDDDFASNFQNGPHSWHGAATNVPKHPYMQFPGAHPSQNADKTTFWTLCASCGIRYQYHRTHVNKVLRCQSCQQSFTAYDLDSWGISPGHPWNQSLNQNGVPNPVFRNGFLNPGPSSASEEEVKELDPELHKYPDPEFSDFDKDRAESCFAVNQVWAIYDTCDGMPRYYARIKKVFSPGFKLQITWLEPDPDDEGENDCCDVDLPVACGKFTYGRTEGNEDLLMFSHQVSFIRGAGRISCLIYPKRGETWALFRDWDIKWSDNPEEHQPPYQYEFVEVLTDFTANVGIGVAYLGKVKGFVGVFQRIAKNGVLSFNIAPGELYRFSYRIPSFRMTGKERDGVPEGSFELDPASLPHDKLSDVGDHKMENRKVDTEPSGSCPRSSQVIVKSKMDSPMKNESDPNRENSERKNHNKV